MKMVLAAYLQQLDGTELSRQMSFSDSAHITTFKEHVHQVQHTAMELWEHWCRHSIARSMYGKLKRFCDHWCDLSVPQNWASEECSTTSEKLVTASTFIVPAPTLHDPV